MSSVKEFISSKEEEDLQFTMADEVLATVVGIAAIIVSSKLAAISDAYLPILTVEENTGKADTGKKIGQRAIVQETIRFNVEQNAPEGDLSTLQGVLIEEIIDGEQIKVIGHHFQRARFGRRPEIPLLSLPGTKGGVEVVVFGGDPAELLHPSSDEISNKRWETVDSFLNNPHARSTSLELVGYAHNNGLISEALKQYRYGQAERIFPDGFQHEQFQRRRYQMPEITKVKQLN